MTETNKSKVDLTYWRQKLDGRSPPITAEDPQHGYYRHPKGALCIRPTDGGLTIVELNGVEIVDPMDASDAWVRSAKHAITKEIYGNRITKGMWPEDEAKVEETPSIHADMMALVEKTKGALKNLESREVAEGETILANQLEADTAAGYVQQIRAMEGRAEEVVKLQVAPLKEKEKEIKRIWIDPTEFLDAAKIKLLGYLTEFGKRRIRETNDPDFKFAAGKAGDGKTIAFRKSEVLVVEDWKVLVATYGKHEDVIKAYQDAIMARAKVDWKATKEAPKGTRVDIDYNAV